MVYTKEQAKQALAIVQIVAECIKDASAEKEGGIPSGHLYAMLLSLPGMTLQTYESILSILVESGRVEKKNDFLTWKEVV